MKPEAVACFVGVPGEGEQKLVWATHAAPAAALFAEEVEGTAWKTKPSWYIVAKNDRSIQPELEHFIVKRMGATKFEADSAHLPMLSQAEFVLDVIRKATKKIEENMAT
jgi:pimeloyl-ACP methyl ester carboxylesterase